MADNDETRIELRTPPPPVQPSRRYASLDACRGMACLLVVIYHSTQYVATDEFAKAVWSGELTGSLVNWLVAISSKLWIGVPIFFVISGYCISAAADDHQQKNRPMTSYFWRRFWRIYPPFWILLALTSLLLLIANRTLPPGPLTEEINLAPMPTSLSLEQWIGNVTLTESWRYHATPAPQRIIIAQSWTLCYEEQFYLLVGLILCVAPKRLFQIMLFLTALIWANAVANFNIRFVRNHGWNLNAFKYSLPGTFLSGEWLQFAAGIGVYYFRIHAKKWSKVALMGGMSFLLVTSIIPFSQFANTQLNFAVGYAFAWLLILLQPWDLQLAASAPGRLLGAFGKISYSMYLIHYPMVKVIAHLLYRAGWASPRDTLLVTVPICLIASTGVAALFYHFVERRFLNSKPAAKEPQPALLPQ